MIKKQWATTELQKVCSALKGFFGHCQPSIYRQNEFLEAPITVHIAYWDLWVLLAPGERYYSSSKHCLCQHLQLKLQVLVLGSCLLPFHRPAPKSRSADQSFPRGTYIWHQDITASCELPLPCWGTSGGRGSMPLGVLTHPPLSSGWQCWPPKVTLKGAQVMGYKKLSGASAFSVFCPCAKQV